MVVTGRRGVYVLATTAGSQILALGEADRLATVGIDTIRRIESPRPVGELRQLPAGLTQGLDVLVQGRHVTFQQVDDVMAGGLPLASQVEDRCDLGQSEPGGLGIADEVEPVDHILCVIPVVVVIPGRLGEEPNVLVVPDGLGGGPGPLGEFSDSHASQHSP